MKLTFAPVLCGVLVLAVVPFASAHSEDPRTYGPETTTESAAMPATTYPATTTMKATTMEETKEETSPAGKPGKKGCGKKKMVMEEEEAPEPVMDEMNASEEDMKAKETPEANMMEKRTYDPSDAVEETSAEEEQSKEPHEPHAPEMPTKKGCKKKEKVAVDGMATDENPEPVMEGRSDGDMTPEEPSTDTSEAEATSAEEEPESKPECMKASYELTITNIITKERFPFIPDGGLVFSPLVGAAHNGKISLLAFRGFANDAVRLVAEQGNNSLVVAAVTNNSLVKSFDAADGPTLSWEKTTLKFRVNCRNTFITALSMIAPSPDWIISLPNYQTKRRGEFIRYASGYLRIYDAGTDQGPKTGSIFTPPDALELDRPQVPQYNIHPLRESDEDPGFRREPVAKWILKRVG